MSSAVLILRRLFALLLLPSALLLAQAHAAPLGRISGSVATQGRAILPGDATLSLELLDITQTNAKAAPLARLALPVGGRPLPLAFELPFYASDARPARRYALRAVLLSHGERLFAATQALPAAALGAGKPVRLVLQQVHNKPVAALENTYWKLLEVNGRPAQTQPGEREAHMLLLGGRASGGSGCNKLMGGYTQDTAGALRIGPLASTRMACAPEMMVQESALADAFERTTAYRIDGETLLLLEGSRVLARFEARYFK